MFASIFGFVTAGATWLSDAFGKVAKASHVAGTKIKEKFQLVVADLTVKEVDTVELENCTAEPRKIQMLLHDDVVYQILQWLPVISLLRFKLVCTEWRALIESCDFIKHHLHHHHYDPNMKDKNHSLIHIVKGKDSPFTYRLISIGSFEGPNACVQLDCSDLREYFPLTMEDIVSYNGIICLNLSNCKGKHSICLWNPATKQSRILPQSPSLGLDMEHSSFLTIVGFGFDVGNNDYKVVNICRISDLYGEKVEVYSLNTDSWRSVATVIPFEGCIRKPRRPFNNGTCFFWYVLNFAGETILGEMILCFDFSSEKFRSISFPNASNHGINRTLMVVSDKIACVFSTKDHQTEIWVFNGYGSVNESWVKLYTIDPFWALEWALEKEMWVKWLCMNGNHLFFSVCRFNNVLRTQVVCGYNVVTKEVKNLCNVTETCIRDGHWCGLRINCYDCECLVDFKESMLSVGEMK